MKDNPTITVTLKAAATLDGKIATATGNSKWITGPAARQKGHELRQENDAVLVGINTVLADDPELTVRGIENGSSPIRIILDSRARIPVQSRVFQNDGVPVVIVVGNQAASREWPELTDLTILTAPTKTPQIKWVLAEIGELGIKSLLVEGGSLIHASFFKSKSVGRLALFLAPKVIGGQEALSWCGNMSVDLIEDAQNLEITSVSAIGQDWFISATIRQQ
ncbi:MAG: bifunctional diaminohydroxyphosphoribosylaminopyrimidine deaminase/5-amino-6-(5-phosphoribosylamino)uracil reductase RibD [SAR324 cluster bacterium]|nr:bifunctional diaminohydroxyphosphoribosylaminopyrimidine deaminase/5-amino-6-(5-phosphoribosylamino)uracil reductase RibD [SAR324 cluster bacterium]